MFGGVRRDKDKSLSQIITPENPPKSSSGGNVTGFDPEGLERAAKAARELDSSKNASAAIELIKIQEATKQVRVYLCLLDKHLYKRLSFFS
jgi:ATPase family AAA domain-containing protein 3A/B